MVSKRLKADARKHMQQNPGTSYQEALRAVASSGPAIPAQDAAEAPDFFTALGISDIATHDFEAAWAHGAASGELRIPYARTNDGELSYLSFLEPGLGGDGPHGGVAGRTGSGKSFTLRGHVLALAALYGPEEVAFALASVKSDAVFRGLDELPQTAICAPQLEPDSDTAALFFTAIEDEVARREELIVAEHLCTTIGEYRRKRESNPDLPPMPHMLIAIDELMEQLEDFPSALPLLVRISRCGRSLGIHLLLSSQMPDLLTHGHLMVHLSIRFSLATGSSQGSIAMIGTDAAAVSPGKPGSGWRRFPGDATPVPIQILDHSEEVPGTGTSAGDALIQRLARVTPPGLYRPSQDLSLELTRARMQDANGI